MPVKPVPEGYTTLSPYLVVDGAAQAIDYYKRVFGATERGRFDGPDGKVAHAELQIGDTVLMVADPSAETNIKAPTQLGATSVGLFLYVEDVSPEEMAERVKEAMAGAG